MRGRKVKKVLSGVDTGIKWVEDVVCIATLAAIVIIATVGVIGRYLFHFGLLWADEVNQALLVAMGMFGSAKAVRMNRHTELHPLSTSENQKRSVF